MVMYVGRNYSGLFDNWTTVSFYISNKLPQSVSMRIISDVCDFAEMRECWDEMTRLSDSCGCRKFETLLKLWRSLVAEGSKSPFILFVYSAGKLVGGVPLYTEYRSAMHYVLLRRLRLMHEVQCGTGGRADRDGEVKRTCDPDLIAVSGYENIVAAAFASYIRERIHSWDQIEFTGVRRDGIIGTRLLPLMTDKAQIPGVKVKFGNRHYEAWDTSGSDSAAGCQSPLSERPRRSSSGPAEIRNAAHRLRSGIRSLARYIDDRINELAQQAARLARLRIAPTVVTAGPKIAGTMPGFLKGRLPSRGTIDPVPLLNQYRQKTVDLPESRSATMTISEAKDGLTVPHDRSDHVDFMVLAETGRFKLRHILRYLLAASSSVSVMARRRGGVST